MVKALVDVPGPHKNSLAIARDTRQFEGMSPTPNSPIGQTHTLQDLEQVLRRTFGHSQWRSGQREILEQVVSNNSVLGLLPTGGGKSLCFQLPALLWGGQGRLVLVVSPLIALMQDQLKKAKSFGIAARALHSQMRREEREEVLARVEAGEFQLLLVTPERLRKPQFTQALQGRQVSLLVVDEAHCVSQWGHDFRPDYSRIGEFRAKVGEPPVLALTATATPRVQSDIRKELRMEKATLVDVGMNRPELALSVRETYGVESKLEEMVPLLEANKGWVIVYFSLISTLEKFSEVLQRKQVVHGVYHGNLPRDVRSSGLKWFQNSETGVMLATPAFGLGVDRANVRTVIHAEIPGSLEAYFQEVGRAGRDGLDARAVLLLDEDDVLVQMDFVKWANPEPSFVRKVYGLIRDHSERVAQEGNEFLREQMSFHNKRDFRLETALNQLERAGYLEVDPKGRRWHLARQSDPSEEEWQSWMSDASQQLRLKEAQKRLLTILQWAKSEDCRMGSLLGYFGKDQGGEWQCGKCDNCLD